MKIIRRGNEGEAVRDVQHRLVELGLRVDGSELHGVFGSSTEDAVREFQRSRQLPVDGLVGPDTWGELVEAGYRLGDRTLYLRSPAFRGDDVRTLQRMLNALGFDAGKEDGIFGHATARAVTEYQRNVADETDGIVGLDTVRSLTRMRPSLDGPSRAIVREAEVMRSMDFSLVGTAVAVDAAHTPRNADPGNLDQRNEAELTLALASEIALALEHRGAVVQMLRPPGEDPTPGDRAHEANESGAVVCVSVDLSAGDPPEKGASCAYWGTATSHSPAGRRLAELIHDELVHSGLPGAGIRPLAITLLRETRMPAVQVEPGRLSDPYDAERLADADARKQIAEAVAAGLERFLRAPTDEMASG